MTGYQKSPDYGDGPKRPLPFSWLLFVAAYVAFLVYLVWFRAL